MPRTVHAKLAQMSGGRVTIRHVPALDGLRGLAVAGVLLFHGGHLTGGYLGVDLFFVLSGFLITSLLLAESDRTGSIGLGGFWARRARRLLPALAGLLVGVAFYCVLFADASELNRIRGDALATLGYVANWRAIVNGQDYWALFQSPSPLEHTWSLAIEEQFYVVWPLLFFGILALCKAWTAKAVLITSLTLAAASSVLMFVLYDSSNISRVYYGTDTRATALLLGVALAAWLSIWGPVKSRAGRLALEGAGFVGLAVLMYAWFTIDGEDALLYQGGFLVLGLAVIAVIAAAAHPEAGALSRVLSSRPLCLLGIISYGVYLWHWPVYVVLDASRTGLDGWGLFAVRVGVTLVIAVTSYLVLESPIRHGALGPRQWQVLTPIAAAGLVVVIVFTTAAAGPSPSALAKADDPKDNKGPLVLVVGDSVGQTVAAGLGRAGVNVKDGTRTGCRITRGEVAFEGELVNCSWPSIWRRLVNQNRPRIALMVSGGWDLFDIQPPGSDVWLQPGTKAWARYYHDTLTRAVEILGKDGAHVVIPTMPYFGPSPLYGGDPSESPSAYNPSRVRAANKVLAAVQKEHPDELSTPDLNRLLSPKGVYQSSLRGIDPIRYDGVHFGSAGQDIVGQWLARHFQPWLEGAEPVPVAVPDSSPPG
jgi:peptidoglycan/LPS O-acetylase OafA/YrhL